MVMTFSNGVPVLGVGVVVVLLEQFTRILSSRTMVIRPFFRFINFLRSIFVAAVFRNLQKSGVRLIHGQVDSKDKIEGKDILHENSPSSGWTDCSDSGSGKPCSGSYSI